MSKIPDHAKKVFEGIIFDVYQYEQELYDGSTITFEKLRRPYTLQCIPIVEDKVLIIKNAQPGLPTVYTFPGGRHEHGETYLEGALREMQEETGYTSTDTELYSVYTPTIKLDWDIYTYICYNATKVGKQTLDAGEKVEQFLVTFDEFVDIVCSSEWMEKEFALEVMRMKIEGTLDTLKDRLFKNKTQ